MPFEIGQPRPEKAGRKEGSANKKNLEVQTLAEEMNFSIARVKLLLAAGRFTELGFTQEQVDAMDITKKLDYMDKNANDLMPYVYGKRKPIDSDGDDKGTDLFARFVEEMNGNK